jgi:hypothetical protein
MATVDQRILIPVSQEVVWKYLSDLSNNPQWQVDCKAVAFLSSKRDGKGTRIRWANEKSQDVILEILSWYNGLGYEYTYVDGSPYKSSKGRIRLQEIPEGTIVQWTFEFELKGVLGRGGSRQIENTMTASLKNLYRKVKDFSKQEGVQAKSLMQEAPGVEERFSYTPRHTPAFDEKHPPTPLPGMTPLVPVATKPPTPVSEIQPVESFAFDFDDEPPIKEDDTRPNPVVATSPTSGEQPVSAASPAADNAEPDFLTVLPDESAHAAFMPPASAASDVTAAYDFDDLDVTSSSEESVEVESALFEDIEQEATASAAAPSIHDAITEPLEAVTTDSEAIETPNAPLEQPSIKAETTSADETEALPEVASGTPTPPVALVESSAPAMLPVVLPQPMAQEEYTPKSIWDIFNVPRPSEAEAQTAAAAEVAIRQTGEIEAVRLSAGDDDPLIRRGLRVRLRRKAVRLRYPE